MKKSIIMAMVLVFCLAGQVQAQTGTDLNSAAERAISSLSQSGMIQLDSNDTDLFIDVEPLFWKTLTHAQKRALVISAMVTAKGKDGVIVRDMTSKSTVATGTIATRRIRIYK
ncbi:MAG: hypothetical protein P8168_07965 [Deltaproteobacteria bacterium]